MIDHLVGTNQTGIFNCANRSVISPYEIGVIMQKKFPNMLIMLFLRNIFLYKGTGDVNLIV